MNFARDLRQAVRALRKSPGFALAAIATLGIGIGAKGLLLAAPLSFAATRLLRGLLFDVRPADPAVLAGTAVFLVLVALAANWFPARSAARVDPARALRLE